MKRSLLKKVLSLVLTLAMLSGLLVPTAFATEGTYSDTKGNWAEASIERWSDYGIIQGNNGKFNPSGQLTRAHMAAILSRLLVLPEAESAGFVDVNGEWFADSINRCAAAGIMLGSNGYANPNAAITRQQAVVMLARALGIQSIKNPDLSAYTDANQVSAYAAGYMAAMAEAGIVKGTSATTLSPYANITRAATVTILDRAIEVYANEEGMSVVAEGTGLVLVVADKVKVTAPAGTTVVVAAGVKNTTVNGEKVSAGQTYIAEEEKSVSGGGGGGSVTPSVPALTNLTISESKTVSNGTYQNVTITDAVGNGDVTLVGLVINGDLIIKGGGSSTITLEDCVIHGKVIMDKDSSAPEAEAPRLLLDNTPIDTVDVQQPAIIEAADAESNVTSVEAKADVEVKGASTTVSTITVPAETENPVTLAVNAGTVETVEAKADTTVTGTSGSVSEVVAEATVSVDSGVVDTVEIPATASENVEIAVNGSDSVEVVVNTSAGVAITTTDSADIDISTEQDSTPAGITVNDVEQTHAHKWNVGEVTSAATCETAGVKTYTCVADGCSDPVFTKTEDIAALGHAYGAWNKEDNNNHKRVCANDSSHIETAAHTWDNGVVSTAATCEADGVKTFTCSVCSGTKTEVIPALGHEYDTDGNFDGKDASGHWYNCNHNCGEKQVLSHTAVTDKAVAATCTETGLTEGSHCSACNYVIVKQEIVDALDHTWGEWTKYDEKQHQRKCLNDSTHVEIADHVWSDDFDTVCDTCSYERKLTGIAAVIVEADDLGILTYLDKNELLSGGNITRLELCMLIAGLWNMNIPEDATCNWQYTDGEELTSQQKAIITLLVQNNVIYGNEEGKFLPENGVTNLATAVFLDRTLGNPVTAYTIDSGIADSHPYYHSVQTMVNLGIVSFDIANGTLAATLEDVLTWGINAKKWRDQNPTNPTYPASDIMIIDGPPAVRWTEPSATGVRFFYEVGFYGSKSCEFNSGSSGMMPLFGLSAGTYNTVEVITYANDGRYCGEYTVTDMDIQVTGTAKSGRNVTFTPNDDGTCTVSISGMTPDVAWHMYLGQEAGDFGLGIGDTADSNGCWNGTIDEFATDMVKNGGYYLLREYPTINVIDTKTCTIEFIECGGWTQCEITSPDDPQNNYNASSIRFEDRYGNAHLAWNTPAELPAEGNFSYWISLSSNGGSDWNLITSTTDDSVPVTVFPVGNYNAVKIASMLDGEEIGICTALDVTFTVTEGPALAPATVTFTPVDDGSYYYMLNISGMSASTRYTLYLRDGNNNNRSSYGGNSDESGIVTGSKIGGSSLADCVANGSYLLQEATSTEITNEGKNCTMIVSNRGGWTKCTPSGEGGDDTVKADIWFEENSAGTKLYLAWTGVELASGHRYYLTPTNSTSQLGLSDTRYNILRYLVGVKENTSLGFSLTQGNWNTQTDLYATASDALKVSVSGTAPSFTIEGQSDGTYQIVSSSTGGYFYKVLTPDGSQLTYGYSADGKLSIAPYEGCTFEVQTGSWTVSEDGQSVTATVSPVATTDTFTPCTASSAPVVVTNVDDLIDALEVGGTVQLGSNITASNMVNVSTGPAATLDLNGYVLDAPELYISSGKELTIIGTKDGSGILYSNGDAQVNAQSYAKLTVNGGQYEKFYTYNARSITLNNVTATAGNQTLQLAQTAEVIINGGSFSATETGDNTSYQTISMNDVGDVVMTGVTASGYYFAVDIYGCEDADITDCVFTGEKDCFRVLRGPATLKNVTATANYDVALMAQDGGHITVESGTYKGNHNLVMQLSGSGDSSITLNGGTYGFVSDPGNTSRSIVYATEDGTHTINIAGGVFQGVYATCQWNGMPENVSVTGGTFSYDPTSDVDTTKYAVIPNEDGTWTVTSLA